MFEAINGCWLMRYYLVGDIVSFVVVSVGQAQKFCSRSLVACGWWMSLLDLQ